MSDTMSPRLDKACPPNVTPEPGERWRDVCGYEGYYMVSSHGRVYSMPREVVNHGSRTSPDVEYIKTVGGKLIGTNKRGNAEPWLPRRTPTVVLVRSAEDQATYTIADLVLEAFCDVGVIPEFRDGDARNCKLSNLVLRRPSERSTPVRVISETHDAPAKTPQT